MEPPSLDVQAQLLEAISDLGIAVLVAKGDRFVYANAAAARLSGFAPGELMSGSYFDMVAPEERARLQARLRERLAGRLADHEEVSVTLRDGRRIVLELAVKLLPEPGSFVVLYRDVTARKAEETRLRHAEKMAAVARLLVGVAHDINTPLAVALSNLDVAREQLAAAEGHGLGPDATRALLERAEANRNHLRRIASSVRRLQGLGAPQALRRTPTDLAPVLGAAVDAARLQAGGRLLVEADVPPLPPVACDGELVGHAVHNLLVNAVEAATSSVRLVARAEGSRLVVVVEDDGPGLGADPERVFEPFFTTKASGNMGLGLTLARSIVQDHGGTLVGGEGKGGGGRLTMTLPFGGA